jgi:hypothetical protein
MYILGCTLSAFVTIATQQCVQEQNFHVWFQPMELTRHASFRFSFTIKAIYPNSVAVAYMRAHVS